jgi:hypothetical protein
VSQSLRIDQVVANETDEDILAVQLATRVVKAGDPLLTAPNVARSPRLAALAEIVKDRLEAKELTVATTPYILNELVGPGYQKVSRAASETSSTTPSRKGAAKDDSRYVRPIVTSMPPDPLPVPSVP